MTVWCDEIKKRRSIKRTIERLWSNLFNRDSLSFAVVQTIRTLREKRGSQHGYFRLEQSPLGSLLAAAYANSWWQDELDDSSYEMNDLQDREIADNAGPDLALSIPVAEALDKIIDYLWQDEQMDFDEPRPVKQKEHIFQSLQTVRRWLDQQSPFLHHSKGEDNFLEKIRPKAL